VRLRDMTPDDAEMVRAWRNQPDVARHMYTDHHISADEHAGWIDRALADPTRRHWIIRHQGQDVGLSCIYDIHPTWRRAQAALYVAPAALRGRGVGAAAEFATLERVFGDLQLDKLGCEVLEQNQAVVQGHLTFGFRHEGLLRQHVVKQGQAMNVVVLGILREEWAQRRVVLAPRIERIERRLERSDEALELAVCLA
jgi:UDP-4-amino-4,6-dideoxy-N-acetyl-beta-L-altrosamine N-acetyltransferase